MSDFNMKKFHHTAVQAFETDPVCGMQVDPQNPPFIMMYKGQSYYFCAQVCKHLFEREPEKYVAASASSGETQPS